MSGNEWGQNVSQVTSSRTGCRRNLTPTPAAGSGGEDSVQPAVWCMVSNGFSIANPADAGMLDVVGFDAAAPTMIADFIRG